ncbi:MAG TPA: hypothetical protein VET90_08525, partial [Candidatus Binatus sp.]|nr:hypothetical protein [Candidatus Binatus sp.]
VTRTSLGRPLSPRRDRPAHTPGMRQWAGLVPLLLGLAGDGYVWTTKARPPVPIERRLAPDDLPGATRRTLRWWRP